MRYMRRARLASLIMACVLLLSSAITVSAQEPVDGQGEAPADFAGAWPVEVVEEPTVDGPDFVPLDVALDGQGFVKGAGEVAAPATAQSAALPIADGATPLDWGAMFPESAQDDDDTDVGSAAIDIVGGTVASRGEYPWQILLLHNGGFTCGGSLIHPRWVLTAAHCVTRPSSYYLPPGEFSVVAGEHNRSVGEGVEQTRDVIQIVVHPGYNPAENDNDIALLELDSPVVVGTTASVIALASSPADDAILEPGDTSTVTGWGDTSEDGDASATLREVAVPLITNSSCASQYAGIFDITANMACAGLPQGTKDACQGDSGGPLVVPTGSGTWKLAGVVSFGLGCAQPNRPGVYARVTQLRAWILQQVAAAGASGALVNPGFDSGSSSGWFQYSKLGYNNILNANLPITPQSPTYLAWLGGGDGESASIYQPIAFGHRAREVTYYYFVDSAESTCGVDVARAGLAIATPGSTGAVLSIVRSTSIPLCDSNETSGWRKGVISLNGLQGYSRLYVFFDLATSNENRSSLFVDTVARSDNAIPPLLLHSFTPSAGMMGALVTVNGNGFLNASQVLFGSKAAFYQVVNDTQIRARAPFNVASSKVQVTTAFASATSASNFGAQPTTGLTSRALVPVLRR